MITIKTAPHRGKCELENSDKDKEIVEVSIAGEAGDTSLCWACLKRLIQWKARKQLPAPVAAANPTTK